MEMWGGGANLPVCRILRRGINVYSLFLPRSGEAEFVQPFPLQVPHAAEQSIPYFFCTNISGSHSQIYNCTYKSLTKTRELLVGSSYGQSLPSTSFRPQSCGGSPTLLHCCIPGGKP